MMRLPPASQALIVCLMRSWGSRPRLYADVRSADSQDLPVISRAGLGIHDSFRHNDLTIDASHNHSHAVRVTPDKTKGAAHLKIDLASGQGPAGEHAKPSLSSARFVSESKTSSRGALKTRDIAISRSPDAETFRAMFSMFLPHRVTHGGCLRRAAPPNLRRGRAHQLFCAATRSRTRASCSCSSGLPLQLKSVASNIWRISTSLSSASCGLGIFLAHSMASSSDLHSQIQ